MYLDHATCGVYRCEVRLAVPPCVSRRTAVATPRCPEEQRGVAPIPYFSFWPLMWTVTRALAPTPAPAWAPGAGATA